MRRLQELGRTLEEIRRAVHGEPMRAAVRRRSAVPALTGSVWRRLVLLPGVELHVAASRRLPPPEQLDEVTRTLRLAFGFAAEDHEERDDA